MPPIVTPAAAPAPPAPKPDAVMYDFGFVPFPGATDGELRDYLEDLLGGQVYVHLGDPVFVTRDMNDVVFHHSGHPEEGKPRYEWTRLPNGVKVGTLTPTAWKGELTENQKRVNLKAVFHRETLRVKANAAEKAALEAKPPAELTEAEALRLTHLARHEAMVKALQEAK